MNHAEGLHSTQTQEREGQIRLATYGKNKRKLIVETKLNLYQNDVKRKVWRRRETVNDVKHMDRETPP